MSKMVAAGGSVNWIPFTSNSHETLVGPLQIRTPAVPNARSEARCHRRRWSFHKWNAEEGRELPLWHFDDTRIDLRHLHEHEFFRTSTMNY